MGRYFKKILGERCYLSPIDPDDYARYTEWLNDLEVVSGLSLLTGHVSAGAEREHLAKLAASGHVYAIVDRETDRLLGNCGLHQVNSIDGTAVVGIFLGDKGTWGQGYGTEALRLLLDYGFNVLNLHSVMLEVYAYNTRAIACYRKVGFREIGRWREAKLVGGRRYDRLLMDITRGDFVGGTLERLIERVHGSSSPAAERFGRFAEAYATSATFDDAGELALLVRLADPRPDWSVLDVATGAGHTALAFAPRVARVVATDLAAPMLEQGRRLAAERGIGNVSFEPADAEALPYADGSFDLVTCRAAPHHFARPQRFLAEARRVLRPGGRLLVQDHLLPEDGPAAREVDGFHRLRDPSHVRAFSESQWRALLEAAGLRLVRAEPLIKRHDFADWTSRQRCDAQSVARLQAIMGEVSEAARAWMRPERWAAAGASFADHHIILLAQAP